MNILLKKAYNINGHDFLLDPLDIDFFHRTISLTGEINDELATCVNAALRCLARDSTDDITIYINSPGGSVAAGFSIYDTAKSLPCDICTVASGIAASMGAVLLTAAGTKGKRWAQPNAEIMIHQPHGGAYGQASDIIIHSEHILKTRDKLTHLLAESTGQSPEKISADIERDYILDAEAAKQYCLIDQIGDPIARWQ